MTNTMTQPRSDGVEATAGQLASPVRISSRVPDPRVLRAINPLVVFLLRSRLHKVLSEQMLLLTCTGRQSGRSITVPVGYLRDGRDLLVVSQHSEQKRWWRNLRGGAQVLLQFRGEQVKAHAEVIEAPLEVATTILSLVARLGPKQASARLYMNLDAGAASLIPQQLAAQLEGVVLVRLSPRAP